MNFLFYSKIFLFNKVVFVYKKRKGRELNFWKIGWWYLHLAQQGKKASKYNSFLFLYPGLQQAEIEKADWLLVTPNDLFIHSKNK